MVDLNKSFKQNTGLIVSKVYDATIYDFTAGTGQATYRLTPASKNNILLGFRWRGTLHTYVTGGAGDNPTAYIRLIQGDTVTAMSAINIDSTHFTNIVANQTVVSEWFDVTFSSDYYSQKVDTTNLFPPYLMGQSYYDFALITTKAGSNYAHTIKDIYIEVFYIDNGIMKTTNLVLQ